ncbi:CesT family type III secretion system chaperone [Vibrio sp. nBUS_14]|uniref:CesT family type III secretion system chaperone n=1 Tax=Vibrio sp. nBUS_14 TaxID=3395321 RepID=UPI003EB90ADB
MSNLHNCFKLLLKKIGLDATVQDLNKEIISLEVGNFTYHFKEFPTDNLVIYSLLDKMPEISMEELLSILNENHFSEQLMPPVFSYDQQNQQFLLWNRQSMQGSTKESILEQLEAVISSNETIQTVLNKDETENQLLVSPKAFQGIRC